jgi:hypothetical protein
MQSNLIVKQGQSHFDTSEAYLTKALFMPREHRVFLNSWGTHNFPPRARSYLGLWPELCQFGIIFGSLGIAEKVNHGYTKQSASS